MLASGLLVGLLHLPVPLILLTMGGIGALFPGVFGMRSPAPTPPVATPNEAGRV